MREDKTILYLDDNADHRDLLKFLFEDASYKILTCSTVNECLVFLAEHEVSAIVMDYWLDGVENLETGEKIKELYPNIPFFYFTGDAQTKSRERALSVGAQAYFLKPDDIDGIVPAISRLLDNSAR
ncbi:MAG: response regulator [Pyrinomonadaceae bacterium]